MGKVHLELASSSKRGVTFERALRIAGYNRPLYLGAGLGIAVGLTLAFIPAAPFAIRILGGAGAVVAAWLAVASFFAFHVMFDRSILLSGEWLREDLSQSPVRWVQLNVGLEETTLPLEKVYPGTEGRLLDLYDPALMTEPAVSRAKSRGASVVPSRAQPDALPVDSSWSDLTIVTLAAHEIRDAHKREQFFRELGRITSSEGRIVVVEHLRNVPAALAFGPGILHFYPRSMWLGLAAATSLRVEREHSLTPFVHVFVLRK